MSARTAKILALFCIWAVLGFALRLVYTRLMRRTVSVGLFLSLTLALFPSALVAQQVPNYDEATLTALYTAFLKKNSADTYLEKRIADERARIRTLADKEVKALVDQSDKDDQALDRQRAIVQQLEEQRRNRAVDVDLLSEEEKKFYQSDLSDADADVLRLTKTHGELLAKKGILEERIAALDAGLALQNDRLGKLNREQWIDQFSSLFGLGSYILIILGAIILDQFVRKRLAKGLETKGGRYLISKIVTAVIYTVTALWIFSKLMSDHPGALASLAIVGAGIAVALQDVVKDFMGWIIIWQRRLFALGDRAAIGKYTGDIIDIGPLRTTMLEVSTDGAFNAHERTGKTLYVPNSMVLRESILNYNTTSDFMSVEMQITITYGSDWKKAESIIHEALVTETGAFVEQAQTQQRRRTALFYTMWEVGEPEVHTDIASSGVLFTLKFTVPIGRRRIVITHLSKIILEKFSAEENIHLAYNTVQVVGGMK